MKTFKLISFAVTAFVLVSCGGGSDEPKDELPQVTITSPTANQTLVRPSDFMLTGTFTDDIGLSSLECNLAFKSATKNSAGEETPWTPGTYTNTSSFTGKTTVEFNARIFATPIPFDCKPGTYTLSIKVTDSGKNVVEKAIDVIIN